MCEESPSCVLLADCHRELTEGVRGLLETTFETVVMVADEASLLEGARRLQPDVAVVDLSLARHGGLDWLRVLRQRSPEVAVVVLSVHDEQSIRRAVMEAGASAFVLKRAVATDLLRAVTRVRADAADQRVRADSMGVPPSGNPERGEPRPAVSSSGADAPSVDMTGLHWEWRTFGVEFGAADATFAALQPELVRESDETYLLSPRLDAGVKIRDGLVEIKKLERVDPRSLEQWWLAMSVPFPLTLVEANSVCAALGVSALPLGKGSLSLGELLAALADPERRVRAAMVHKLRRLYWVGGCRSEITEVVAEGRTTRTLSIEATDAGRVMAVVHGLELSDRKNTSYPRWLKAVLCLRENED